jgi:Fe-S-cluster containining protein
MKTFRLIKKSGATKDKPITSVRWICHKFCSPNCVEQKRRGLHLQLLRHRAHWSVLKREEQFAKIDLGKKVPFDIALPLPAKDRGFAETGEGVELFHEIFNCQHCGKCCYTRGAGLYLDRSDFERISRYLGSNKKLKSLCRYDKNLDIWALKQPCPFYNKGSMECRIYSVRPSTCAQYPLHPPLKEMPYNLAVDAFCPAARELAKQTLGWWIICENNWAKLLEEIEESSS